MQTSLLYHSSLYIVDALLDDECIIINVADQVQQFSHLQPCYNGEKNIIFIEAFTPLP